MPKPYDYDLRKRTINLINSGRKRKLVSQLLNISIPTIDRWIGIYKETKDIKSKNNIKTGRKNIIKDIIKFTEFIENNKLFTLHDMANNYNNSNSNSNISFMTISRNLKKLGYSFKKNSGYILNETTKLEKSTIKK